MTLYKWILQRNKKKLACFLTISHYSPRPYILCLDSLGGSHPAMFKMLRSFLQQELLSRKGIDATLTTDNVPGKHSSKVWTRSHYICEEASSCHVSSRVF